MHVDTKFGADPDLDDDLAPDCNDPGDDLPEELADLVLDHEASPPTPDNVDEEG